MTAATAQPIQYTLWDCQQATPPAVATPATTIQALVDAAQEPVVDGPIVATRLFDYQALLVRKAFAAIRGGSRRVLVHAPTGAGKTVVMGHIIKVSVDGKRKVLVLAHTNELIDQTREKVLEAGIADSDIGMIIAGVRVDRRLEKSVYIASKDTLNNRLAADLLDLDAFHVILIDEAHRSAADTYAAAFSSSAAIIGVTATPIRNGSRGLGGNYYNAFILGPSLRELIDMGRLVQPRYYVAEQILTPEELAELTLASGEDYNDSKVGDAMERKQAASGEVYGSVVKAYKEKASGRQALLFAPTVAVSRGFAAEFVAAGIEARHIDGNTPKEVRREIVDAYRRGEIDLISSVNVFCEGFDAPNCSCVILARPTKSLIFHIQSAGRALRSAPGKRDCVILDHVNNVMREGLGPVERTQEWELPDFTLSNRYAPTKKRGARPSTVRAQQCPCPTNK